MMFEKTLNFRHKLKFTLRNLCLIPLLYLEWSFLKLTIRAHAINKNSISSLLIASPDPNYLVGSKGDEAMMVAIIEMLQANIPNIKVGILTNLEKLPDSLINLNVDLIKQWSNPWSLRKIIDIAATYDATAVIGADVMDGHYVPLSAARLWVVADLVARLGKRSVVTGFSFNEKPSGWLKLFIRHLAPQLSIFSRDSISQKRFNDFIGSTRAGLVADAAFMLTPSMESRVFNDIKNKIDEAHANGMMVCGFNIHPMLIKNATTEQVDALVKVCSEALTKVISETAVYFVFIPHDYRGVGMGDVEILEDIYKKVAGTFTNRAYFYNDHLHAKDLKGIAGLMDLVITGRMHLAIATLGSNVPVAAITYQGKFHGLFNHFDLSHDFLISPESILGNTDKFSNWIKFSITNQPKLKGKVNESLNNVKLMSLLNLQGFWER